MASFFDSAESYIEHAAVAAASHSAATETMSPEIESWISDSISGGIIPK